MEELRLLSNPALRQKALEILAHAHLPTIDITDATQLYGLLRNNEIIGTGGLDLIGSAALMRSVSVLPAHQKEGLGRKIVHGLEAEAKKAGMAQLFLLTNNAATFFSHLLYQPIDRTACPEEIKNCPQFTSICPSSAVVMRKSI